MMILRMTEEHAEQVAQLETVCFQDPWSLRSILYEVQNPLSLWLVALEGDQVVGYIGSQSVLGEADMMNLAVEPDSRGKGIGESLVCELERRLDAEGVSSMTLEVRVSNDNAIRLYHKLGFVQVGRRPNYYHHPKEDAFILRKEWKHEHSGS